MKTLSSWDALLAAPARCDHLVQLYTSDEALESTVVRFIEHGLAEGEGVIAITTAGYWTAIVERLAANGVDVAALQAKNQLIVRDAHDTLMSFMVDGMPDRTARTATASIAVTVSNGGGGGGAAGPPTVSITSPPTGTWTGNSITVEAMAADDAGVVSIKLWGNGGVFGTIPCGGKTCTGKVGWLTGPLPKGAYEVNAVATDTAGNTTTSATVLIKKDGSTPVVPSGAP